MNYRRIAGLVFVAVGVYLVIFAVHSQQKINQAKGMITDFKNFFTHNPMWNPIVTFFGGKAQEKVAEYDTQVTVCLILGILLIVGGVILALLQKRKKRK